MRKSFLLVLVVLFGIHTAFAQSHYLRGTIPGLANAEVYLMQDFAVSQQIVDTITTDQQGSFDVILPDNLPIGMYRIMTTSGQMFDLIYNHEDIAFQTSGFQTDDRLEIIRSSENLLYYKYLNIKLNNQQKINILTPTLKYYPKNDSFYTVLKKQLIHLYAQIDTVSNWIIQSYPNTLAAHFVRFDRPQIPDFNLDDDAQQQNLKTHFFKGIDFGDTLLLRTGLLTSKIVAYLSLYQEKGMSKAEVEKAFTQAVDTLLQKTLVNESIYEYTLNYLVRGFDEFGFEHLLEHIAMIQQLNRFPGRSLKKQALEAKLAAIIRLADGNPAPDFSARDLQGKRIKLSKIKAEKTLLVFWASWCPHCTSSLPRLKKYYDPLHPEKLQIIAISVDEDKNDVTKAIQKEHYPWINIAQLKGWDSPVAEAYDVSATPSFFLLDKDKKIIAKPRSIEKLEEILKGGQPQ
jgi:peroxiredoxin